MCSKLQTIEIVSSIIWQLYLQIQIQTNASQFTISACAYSMMDNKRGLSSFIMIR